jgi:ATP-binding cassette subfamily B protein
MHKGEIREVGTHAELLQAQGIYHRLYRLQYQAQETALSADERRALGEASD